MRERKRGSKGNWEIFDDFQAIISGVAINMPTLVRIRKRLTSDVRGRSKDAPLLWAAQRKYEEKHQGAGVRADEEIDVGV